MNKYTISTYSRLKKDRNFQFWGSNLSDEEQLGRAILGSAPTPLGEVVVYDTEDLIEIFEADFIGDCAEASHDECDHYGEAADWVGFNIAGAWIGDRTPISLARFCAEHDMQTVVCPCPLAELDSWWENRVSEAEKRGIAAPHEGKAA